MYSGSYSSHRFSPLTQITPENVAQLRPVWVYQPPGTGSVESTPVVANGVMYVTSGPTMVARAGPEERQAAVGMDAADRGRAC